MLADVDQIPDAVAEAFAAGLELRAGTLAERVAHHGAEVAGAVEVLEERFALEHFEHLLGVVLPVRGAVDVAARTNAGGEESDEGLGDEAALVMAGLAPGIGEVDVHAVEGVLGDHVAHDFNGVVADDAHIGEGHLVEALGKRADAGHEDLAAEEVDLGVGLRDGGGRLAHAAADFENERGVAAEGLVGVEKLGGVLDLVLRERLVKGALLGGRDVAAAHDEGADVALLERLEFFRRQLGLFAVLFHGAEQGRAARGGGRYEKIPQLTLRRDPWNMERVKGIEPSSLAWEAIALPLSYTR